ncbi:hypothetical protein Zmor_017868 [Zophobas morio]|uniref:Uncharacterized protein n=1 Tax=Zophobas morio TaxID=2755281 RepID=A0AA38MD96_9CUCU|nr:hypothetical protein Zmor_017868 [Zophobas morio]
MLLNGGWRWAGGGNYRPVRVVSVAYVELGEYSPGDMIFCQYPKNFMSLYTFIYTEWTRKVRTTHTACRPQHGYTEKEGEVHKRLIASEIGY